MTEHKHVALLRGINVGKAKRIAMSDLQRIVQSQGFTDVRTLLNSGNIVYTANDVSPEDAAARIEAAIKADTGIFSRVLVLTGDEIATAVAENPLLDVGTNHSRLFVAALYDPAHLSKLQPLLAEDWGEEAFALGTRVAYLWCPNLSVGSPVMDAMGKALGKADTVTVRNWATTLKLHAMCQA